MFHTLPLKIQRSFKEHAPFDKIHTTLGLKTLDELNNTQAQICRVVELDCFREGFRLGAALTLEALRD